MSRWRRFASASGDDSSYSSSMLKRLASHSIVPTKSRLSSFSMKEIASPPTPQPKQWYVPRSGDTEKLGDFS